MDPDNPWIAVLKAWIRDLCNLYCLKDGSSFKLVQTVTPSWLEIQVQYNFIVAANAKPSIWAQNLASALCATGQLYILSYDQFNIL